MPKWKVWYGDGSSFSDEDGLPEEAPGFNVQVITQENEQSGRYNQCLDDYYIFRDGRWFGVDFVGFLDYVVNELGAVKLGRTLTNEKFQKILELAESDPDFPKRSAYHKSEKITL